jgi:hypothetical protein
LSADEARPFEGQHHLVNRRWADAEVFLHVGFGRRAAVQARVEGINARYWPCLGVKVFAGRLTLPSDSAVGPRCNVFDVLIRRRKGERTATGIRW